MLPRLQRLVDRAMYGDRGNPAGVVSEVGSRLATADTDLGQVLAAVRTALRLPYVAAGPRRAALAGDGEPAGARATGGR